MPICPAEGCRQPILEGQPTLKISPGTLMRGKKTGSLYHSATFEIDTLIHYQCVFRLFDPHADAEMYDRFYESVHDQIRAEELDEIKQQAYSVAAEDVSRLCPECLNNRTEDPDKPPEEYSCSGCGSAALPVCPDCGEVTDLALEDVASQAA